MQELSQVDSTFESQKEKYQARPFPSYQQRKQSLLTLKALLLENQDSFVQAMSEDFGNRSADDSKIGDILTTVANIKYCLSNLKSWMKPEKRHVGVLFQPATARIEYQPLGVIGIMVPWNYPLGLSLGPLAQALASGNRALIKMSEYTPATSKLLKELVEQYFDDAPVSIIEGDATVAAHFSTLKFDHILFTGSTNVGRLVMQEAAKNLVPVTLELGGKSPAIIAPDMSIKTAVERFILGKTLNAGQTCVAPDYLFVPKGKSQEVVDCVKALYQSMYPTVEDNCDCTSIITERMYSRLQNLLSEAKVKGAEVIPANDDLGSSESRKMPLTIVLNANDDMQVMQEEIFGPILPVFEYEDISEAIEYINNKERPLALYIYSFNMATQKFILQNTHSGGVCLNEASFHVAIEDLPFGGVGSSGIGSYHGIEGFKTFSHAKSVLARGRISVAKLLFPPFGTAIHKLVYKLFLK